MEFELDITETAKSAIVDQAAFYLAESGERLARRWILAVDDTVRDLLKSPYQGRRCFLFRSPHDQLRRISVQEFSVFLIFYRVEETVGRLLIQDIIHGARDLERVLDQASTP